MNHTLLQSEGYLFIEQGGQLKAKDLSEDQKPGTCNVFLSVL
jgi:hypothetical protein